MGIDSPKRYNEVARRLWALIIKESLQIIRDPSSILISVVLPLILLFLYGFGVSLDIKHLRIGVVMEETSPEACHLVDALIASPYLDVTVVQDRREIMHEITKGGVRGFVVIPSYFSQWGWQRGRDRIPLQLIADGSEPNTAHFVESYVGATVAHWEREERDQRALPAMREGKALSPPPVKVTLDPRYWYNEELESQFFLLSGSLAIVMTLIGTLLTALVVAREWERGTMEMMLSTPVGVFELILGKLLPYFVLGMGSMGLCTAICLLGFHLPFRGSFLMLTTLSTVFLFCALSFGLLISILSKNQVIAYQISVVVGFLPAYILSGFLFEISSMPLIIQWFTLLFPAKYFVQSLQALFLVGTVWPLLLSNILSMMIIGTFLFTLSVFKMSKRLD